MELMEKLTQLWTEFSEDVESYDWNHPVIYHQWAEHGLTFASFMKWYQWKKGTNNE